MPSYTIKISDEDIFQVLESLIIYRAVISIFPLVNATARRDALARVGEAIRGLIREPLKDPRFRVAFGQFLREDLLFESDPAAREWLENLTTWEE